MLRALSMPTPFRHFLRALGPAIPGVSRPEALRAGFGAFVGLAVAGLMLLSPLVDPKLGLYMIAPFGATAVLLFAAPNSPLAQPWSAVMGNAISAAVAVTVTLTVPHGALAIALSVGLAIMAMILLRAVHPPGGAVAMTAALTPDVIAQLGYRFVLTPVICGTLLLVVIAMIYAHLTGRRYPFRHFEDRNIHGTRDPEPVERLGLSEAELTDILERYRQSLNLGAEDLARLIGAAQMQAATHHTSLSTASEIMSRDLVTVGPTTPLNEVAEIFRRHAFTSLPVVDQGDRYLGAIFQLHLIRRAREDAFADKRGFGAAMGQLLDRGQAVDAAAIMDTNLPTAAPDTPIAALLHMMAEGDCDAVPVLDGPRIIGIVTRTDMIAALARQSLRV